MTDARKRAEAKAREIASETAAYAMDDAATGYITEALLEARREATAEERERCAGIVEAWCDNWNEHQYVLAAKARRIRYPEDLKEQR